MKVLCLGPFVYLSTGTEAKYSSDLGPILTKGETVHDLFPLTDIPDPFNNISLLYQNYLLNWGLTFTQLPLFWSSSIMWICIRIFYPRMPRMFAHTGTACFTLIQGCIDNF